MRGDEGLMEEYYLKCSGLRGGGVKEKTGRAGGRGQAWAAVCRKLDGRRDSEVRLYLSLRQDVDAEEGEGAEAEARRVVSCKSEGERAGRFAMLTRHRRAAVVDERGTDYKCVAAVQ